MSAGDAPGHKLGIDSYLGGEVPKVLQQCRVSLTLQRNMIAKISFRLSPCQCCKVQRQRAGPPTEPTAPGRQTTWSSFVGLAIVGRYEADLINAEIQPDSRIIYRRSGRYR